MKTFIVLTQNLTSQYRPLEPSELPDNISQGCTFSTLDINVPIYLSWLYSEVASRGGVFVEKKIESLEETLSLSPDLVVTAVGLGAGDILEIKDTRMDASRGQVVLIKAPWMESRSRGKIRWSGLSKICDEGYRDVYVIPRGDGTLVVGGTRLTGDWNEEPREETTRAILERVLKFLPQLARPGSSRMTPTYEDVDILSVNVGLRPVREGGARLEIGKIGSGGSKIVHAYG